MPLAYLLLGHLKLPLRPKMPTEHAPLSWDAFPHLCLCPFQPVPGYNQEGPRFWVLVLGYPYNRHGTLS